MRSNLHQEISWVAGLIIFGNIELLNERSIELGTSNITRTMRKRFMVVMPEIVRLIGKP